MEPIPTICKGRVDNRDMSGARSTSLTSAKNNFKQAINRRNLVAVITSRPPYVIPFFCKPNPTGHFVTTSKTGAQQLAGCNLVDVLPTRLLRESVLPERTTLFSGRLQNCYVPRDAASIRIKSIPTRCDGAVQLSRAHHAVSTQNDNNYSFSTPVYLGNFKASVTPQHVLFTAGGWHALYGEWFCGCFVNKIKPVPGEMRPNGYAHHGHTPPDNPRYMDACERHTWRRLERARQRLEMSFGGTQQAISQVHPVPCTYSEDSLNSDPMVQQQQQQQKQQPPPHRLSSCGANEGENFVSVAVACKKRRNHIQNVRCFSRSPKRQKHGVLFRSSSSDFFS